MAGRYAGISLDFEAVCRYIFCNLEYWIVEGDSGAWAAWAGSRFLGAAKSQAAAKNLCVRDYERELRGR